MRPQADLGRTSYDIDIVSTARVPTSHNLLHFAEKEVRLKPRNKGCFLVHDEIVSDPDVAQAIAETKVGVMHLFIKHTSAALTVNENVRRGQS